MLVGGPGVLARFSRSHPQLAFRLAALLAALLGLLAAYHAWRVRQLRLIPVRAELSAAGRRVLGLPGTGALLPEHPAGAEDSPDAFPGRLGAVPKYRGAVPRSRDSVPILGDSVPILGDSVPILGDSAPILGDSVQVIGDAVQVTGESVNETGDAVQVTGDSVNGIGDAAPVLLPHEALFRQCRAFVLGNLHRELGPAELADHAAVSVRNLQRFFRDELDLTPAAFIVQLRLEAAAGRLRQLSRPSIGELDCSGR